MQLGSLSESKDANGTQGIEESDCSPPKVDNMIFSPQLAFFSQEDASSPTIGTSKFKVTVAKSRDSRRDITSRQIYREMPSPNQRNRFLLDSINTGEQKTPLDGTSEFEEHKKTDNSQEKNQNDLTCNQSPQLLNIRDLASKYHDQIEDSPGNHDEQEGHFCEETISKVSKRPYFIKNGFTNCPPNILQVSSYFLIGYLASVFSVIILKSYSTSVAIPIALIYYTELLILGVLTLWATWKDPTVATSIQQINFRANKGPEPDTSHFEFFCSWCQVLVGEKTKHCRKCGRDVERFDHHCLWLNNCIGQQNYCLFVQLIISCSLFLLTSSLTSLGFLIVESISERKSGLKFSFVSVSLVISLLFWVLVTRLIWFHWYLHRKNLTTYEYILQRRKKREKNNECPRQFDKVNFFDKLSFPEEPNLKEIGVHCNQKIKDPSEKYNPTFCIRLF